jgi:hypothetical protein
MRRLTTTSLALACATLWACEAKPPEAKPEPKPAPAATGAAAKSPHGAGPHGAGPHGAGPKAAGADAKAMAGGLGWVKPEAWEKVDHPSRMRKATFKIKAVEGDSQDAEMSVTQVGGGIEANIKRWEGQFDGSPAAKLEKKKAAGFEVTVVTIDGTYKGGGPAMGGGGEPTKDWALLAAIVNTTPAHFFKMTGPKKTVDAARGDFDSLVASFGENK